MVTSRTWIAPFGPVGEGTVDRGVDWPRNVSKGGVRRLIAVVLLIAAVFATRQFAPAPDGFAAFRPVSASELARRPEAHMYFPGSIVLDQSKQDETGASKGDYVNASLKLPSSRRSEIPHLRTDFASAPVSNSPPEPLWRAARWWAW